VSPKRRFPFELPHHPTQYFSFGKEKKYHKRKRFARKESATQCMMRYGLATTQCSVCAANKIAGRVTVLRCAYEQQISNYGKKAKFELRGIGDMAEAGGEAQAYGKDP
jgi:hypothetical protein